MKLLIDMNLSPRWANLIADAGIEAMHWSTLGAANAPEFGHRTINHSLLTLIVITMLAGPLYLVSSSVDWG